MCSIPINGNRWKPGPIGVGIKLGTGKGVHERLVDVEFNVGDAPSKGETRRLPDNHLQDGVHGRLGTGHGQRI